MCNTKIHETQPLLNLKLDRVMQDIVYKLVPGLQESECPGGQDRVSHVTGVPWRSWEGPRAGTRGGTGRFWEAPHCAVWESVHGSSKRC